MKYLLFFICFPFSLYAQFHTGDLLFQPLHCRLCEMIEEETGGPFSHIGMVVEGEKGEWFVLEAFEKVRLIPLESFLSKTQKGQPVVVGRFSKLNLKMRSFKSSMIKNLGAPYDSFFLWDNVREDGLEYFYCSEIITKLIQPYLPYPLPLKPMTFDRRYIDWERYFRGPPPQGELGNSPMDFYHLKEVKKIGEWQGGIWSWY